MMIIPKTLSVVGLLLLGSSATAIDTSETILCAVTQVNECVDGFGCEAVLPELVNVPTFIWVAMKKNRLRTNQNNAGSKIVNMVILDGRHILQGAEDGDPDQIDGAAWTLSIEDETGRFVGAIAVEQASISLFGACTELD